MSNQAGSGLVGHFVRVEYSGPAMIPLQSSIILPHTLEITACDSIGWGCSWSMNDSNERVRSISTKSVKRVSRKRADRVDWLAIEMFVSLRYKGVIMEALFYLFGLFCIYSYFLYPLLLKLVPTRSPGNNGSSCDAGLPSVSLIITVHNEESRIKEKLYNSLQIEYPEELLEIIVASDFSTDETDSIVESYYEGSVRLVKADERKGKEYAQLCAIREASGEILVFSDVATHIRQDSLHNLVRRFSDRRVGAVSSEDCFISNDGRVVGEGAYVKYEMWLRRMESARAGLVGLSGSFFAARREVCVSWDIYSPSDFNTALNCVKQGLIAVTSPDVVGIYKDVKDPALEYRRKMRTVIRGITAVTRHPEVLNPFKMGVFSFQVWSHKIMRWGVPWFMLAFAVLTMTLQGQGMIYTLALLAQVVFYALALAGWISAYMRENAVVRIVFFFVQTNLALAQAALAFLAGKRMTVWTPSQR